MQKIYFKCYNCGRCCRNLLFEDQGILNGLSLRTKKEADLFPKEMVFPSFGIGLDPNDSTKPKKIVSYQLEANDCPFISDSNVCQLYEKRPLVCRGFPLMSMGKLGVSITSAEKCIFVEKVEKQIGSLTSFLPMTPNKIKAKTEWKAISNLSSKINKFIIEPTICGKAIWKFNLKNKEWIRQR